MTSASLSYVCLTALLLIASSAAQRPQYYELDPVWPAYFQPQPPSSVGTLCSVAVVTTATGDTEVHVAQRQSTAPPFFVLDFDTGNLLRTQGTWNVTLRYPHGLQSTRSLDANVPSQLWVSDIQNGTVLQLVRV